MCGGNRVWNRYGSRWNYMMAVGALSNSDATTEAARYAWDMGTVLVGAAGDENAYHHNFQRP